MSHQQRAYLDAGMNGVVAKPISPAALMHEIARVMTESEGDSGEGPTETAVA
jgi:CheY-like chemotaxis protein